MQSLSLQDRLQALQEPFDPSLIKKLPHLSEVYYVSAEEYIKRFNSALGVDGWSMTMDQLPLARITKEEKLYRTKDAGYMDGWFAQHFVRINIFARDKDGDVLYHNGQPVVATYRESTGAHTGSSVDHVAKTAQANAFKKAARNFGIGLELSDEEYTTSAAQEKNERAREASFAKFDAEYLSDPKRFISNKTLADFATYYLKNHCKVSEISETPVRQLLELYQAVPEDYKSKEIRIALARVVDQPLVPVEVDDIPTGAVQMTISAIKEQEDVSAN
jgi:hypothetical protein